jgi:hypothetical protein
MTKPASALSRFLWHFDSFTGEGMASDEDWIWHILLVYTETGQHAAIAREALALLRSHDINSDLFAAYKELGGAGLSGDPGGVRRFLETTIELVPHAVAIRSALPEDTDDAWTRTPRPRLARESA